MKTLNLFFIAILSNIIAWIFSYAVSFLKGFFIPPYVDWGIWGNFIVPLFLFLVVLFGFTFCFDKAFFKKYERIKNKKMTKKEKTLFLIINSLLTFVLGIFTYFILLFYFIAKG